MFPDTPATAQDVDLPRYLGRWFEIARLPMRFQPEDCTDVVAEYSPGDNDSILVRNRCVQHDGKVRSSEGVASIASSGDTSKLKVSFLPEGLRWIPFTRGDYWILRIDRDYGMSLVGTPNLRYLWLLARTARPDPTMRDSFLAHASELGYDLTALIHTPHGQQAQGRNSTNATASRH